MLVNLLVSTLCSQYGIIAITEARLNDSVQNELFDNYKFDIFREYGHFAGTYTKEYR